MQKTSKIIHKYLKLLRFANSVQNASVELISINTLKINFFRVFIKPMYTHLFTRLFICVILILNASCIHTQSYVVKQMELEKDNKKLTNTLTFNKLQINSVIYSEGKFPLSDFFSKLARGDFEESFKHANLSYKPSNTSNEILRNLLSSGLVPVYVSIKNTSSSELKVSFNQFHITNGSDRYRAFNPEFLPREIKRFSPAAAAANVYNITITSASLFMVALLLASATSPYTPSYDGHGMGNENSIVINKTEKTTRFDYKNYIINKKTLKPNEEIYGLLFFNTEKQIDAGDFNLEIDDGSAQPEPLI